nr:hypothetical protein [Tanacetum cinerariifolium]
SRRVVEGVKTIKLRRLRKVRTSQRIESSTDTIMEAVSNQGRMTEESNKDEVLSMQEEEPEVQEAVEVVTTAKLITEVVAAVSGIVSVVVVIPAHVTDSILWDNLEPPYHVPGAQLI